MGPYRTPSGSGQGNAGRLTSPGPLAWRHEDRLLNAPAWRIWLITALMCGWGILGIRFIQKGDTPLALMCLLLLVANGVTLWRLTRKGK